MCAQASARAARCIIAAWKSDSFGDEAGIVRLRDYSRSALTVQIHGRAGQ